MPCHGRLEHWLQLRAELFLPLEQGVVLMGIVLGLHHEGRGCQVLLAHFFELLAEPISTQDQLQVTRKLTRGQREAWGKQAREFA